MGVSWGLYPELADKLPALYTITKLCKGEFKMPENENIETQVVDNTTDYITAINELKANSVDKSKYEALLNENKKLINNLVNSQPAPTEAPVKPEVDIQALRNDLFNKELSNLEYCKKALDLRQAILDTEGKDIFVGDGHKAVVAPEDFITAQRVADVMKDAIDYADGDSQLFTQELMRRTNDIRIPRR